MTVPPRPLLVIDAGHTRIKFALCNLTDESSLPHVQHILAPMVDSPFPWDQIEAWCADLPTEPATLLTGSNPVAIEQVRSGWPETCGPIHILQDRSQLPISVALEQPERVGIDRLLTAIAANRLRAPGQTSIIVDSGTAITIDALTSDGAFCGGAILPGVRMGSQALHRYTATLPEIDASTLLTTTPDPLGRNTTSAIESGLYWGHIGAVRELILRQRDRVASFDKAKDKPSLLLFTGGASQMLEPHFSHARFEPFLALQGLALVAAQLNG